MGEEGVWGCHLDESVRSVVRLLRLFPTREMVCERCREGWMGWRVSGREC